MDCLLIKLRLKGIFAGLLLVGATSLQGIVLDWATNPWPGGTSATFTDVDGSGIDVSVSLTLEGGAWHQPLQSSGGNLIVFPDWSTNVQTTSYVDVTISFSQPVVGFSLSFLDVDRGPQTGGGNWVWRQGGWVFIPPSYAWQDIIERARGFNNSNLVSYATATTVGSGIVQSGSPTNLAWTAVQDSNWAPNSQLALNWSGVVDTISYRYSSGSTAQSDPFAQVIGMSGFTFYSAVPEAGTVVTAALMLLGLGAFSARRYVLRKKAISVQSLEARDHAS
jgi:hypothetical protein